MDIKPINGVGDESLMDKLKALFKKVPVLRTSKKHLHYLNQKKNGACTTFASAGALQYNSGSTFTNEYLEGWAKGHNWDKLGPLGQVAKVFAEEHKSTCIPLNIDSGEARKILEAGYSLVISTRCPTGFFRAGMTTGVAMGKFTGEPFAHAMYLYQNERHMYVVNSWGDYVKQGMYNKYEIRLKDMIGWGYIRQLCYLII